MKFTNFDPADDILNDPERIGGVEDNYIKGWATIFAVSAAIFILGIIALIQG